MKLLLPVFASLVLQYHVNAEFLIMKRCLNGLGKCKDNCTENEKEIQKCKKKKCCGDLGSTYVRSPQKALQCGAEHDCAFEGKGAVDAIQSSAG
ncbi:beta-defensin 129 [Ctenodactylus gundi]